MKLKLEACYTLVVGQLYVSDYTIKLEACYTLVVAQLYVSDNTVN